MRDWVKRVGEGRGRVRYCVKRVGEGRGRVRYWEREEEE